MDFLRSRSIRWQLRFLLLALGVPFLAYLLVSASREIARDREIAGQQMLGVARTTAARLDDYVGDITQLLATTSAVVSTNVDDVAPNNVILQGIAERSLPQFSDLSVWDFDGHSAGALKPTVPMPGGSSEPAILLKALASRTPVIEAPVLAGAAAEAVGIFALRVERRDNVVGTVSVSVQLRQLQKLILPDGDIPKGGLVTIIDMQGMVLARSVDFDGWVGRRLTSASGGLLDLSKSAEGVRFGPSADGIDRIAAVARSRRVPWVVYVGLPQDMALAPAQTQLYETLAVGIALIAIGLVLSSYLARRISSPLLELEGDAATLGLGDLTHRSGVVGSAEITSLSASLNRMANALEVRTTRLAQSEEELADLYANAPCGYYSLDTRGIFVRINDIALHWLGCMRDDVLGKLSITDFMNAEGQAVFKENFPKLIERGFISDVEFDLLSRTGTVRRLVLAATVVRDEDGRFSMTRSAVHDVTEIRAAKQALRRLADEQKAMLDTDLIGIVRVKNRRIVWANPGAARLLNFEMNELVGQPGRVVYPDDESYDRIGAATYPVLATGRSFRTQLQLMRRGGEMVWVDMMGISMPSGAGEALFMIVDISPLKNAEEERMRSLTLESKNQQLAESNRVKDLFLANMSHELHTPLNAVIGYSQILRSGRIPAGSAKFVGYVDRIESGGKDLLHLIDSMLNFARLDSGKISLRPEPVNVAALIAEAVIVQRQQTPDRQIRASEAAETPIGEVVIDRLHLLQALSQLLANAAKFSAKEDPISVSVRPEGASMFRVDVTDLGIGIAAADLPRLFKPFQQLSEGTTKKYHGAGLGLALTRRLVEDLGGTVAVSSEPGKGSTFSLVLPRG